MIHLLTAIQPLLLAGALPYAPALAPIEVPSRRVHAVRDSVEWFEGALFSVKAKAEAEGKPVVFVFVAEDSAWCDKLLDITFEDGDVLAELAKCVCVKVDLTRDEQGNLLDPNAGKLADKFPVRAFPTLVYVGSDLKPDDFLAGYAPPAHMLGELQRMLSGNLTLSHLRAEVQRAPDDVEWLWKLSQKLDDFGYANQEAEAIARIEALDPERRSRPLRAYDLAVLEEELFRTHQATGVYDHARLIAFLEDETNPSVALDGWTNHAGVLRGFRAKETDAKRAQDLGREARDADRRAWNHVQDATRTNTAVNTLVTWFDERADLRRKDRLFASELAAALEFEIAKLQAVRPLPPSSEAQVFEVRACAAGIQQDKDTALKWIDKAIEKAPAEPRLATRRQELLAL